MTQLTLEAHSRSTDPETSRLAAESLTPEKLSRSREAVLRVALGFGLPAIGYWHSLGIAFTVGTILFTGVRKSDITIELTGEQKLARSTANISALLIGWFIAWLFQLGL